MLPRGIFVTNFAVRRWYSLYHLGSLTCLLEQISKVKTQWTHSGSEKINLVCTDPGTWWYQLTSCYTANPNETGLSSWLIGKEPACQCKRCRFNSWVRKNHWRRKWQLTPVFLPGKSRGQRNLEDHSPWGCKRVRHDWATEYHHHQQLTNNWHGLKPSRLLCAWDSLPLSQQGRPSI